jgi:hypothetical protein
MPFNEALTVSRGRARRLNWPTAAKTRHLGMNHFATEIWLNLGCFSPFDRTSALGDLHMRE